MYYEGFGVDKNKVGTAFGNSAALLKVTLGSGSVIRGLEQGVQGMRKGGQRIVVGDDGDRCLQSWLAGAVDAESCKAAVPRLRDP